MKIEIFDKKGISPVIATVLLVLVTFIAVGIVWGFILPMIKGNLEESGGCFKLRDYAEVVEGEYTCFNSSGTKVMIKRGMANHTIKGFRLSIVAAGEAKLYDITEYSTGIKMWQQSTYTEDIELPDLGEARTYLFEGISGTRVDLGIITESGNLCDMGSYDLPAC